MIKEIRGSLALRLLALLLGVVGSILIARLGGPEVKGVSSAFAAASATGFMILNLDAGQAALRFARNGGGNAWKFLSKVWTVYCALIPVGLLMLLLLDVPLGWYLLGAISFGLAAQAGVLAVGYNGPLIGSLGAVLQQTALIAGVTLFASFSSLDEHGVKIILLLSYVAPLPLYILKQPRAKHKHASVKYKEVFSFLLKGLPWQLGRLAQTLIQKLDVLLVFALLGASQSGIYSVGISTAMLVTIIPAQYASQALHDIASQRAISVKDRSVPAAISGALSSVPLILGGYWFIKIAYGTEFTGAYTITLACIPGAIAYGVLQVQSNYIRLLSTWRVFLAVHSTGALIMAVTLVLTVLIWDWKLLGAAVAFTSGALSAAIVAKIFVVRTIPTVKSSDLVNSKSNL